MFDENIMRVHYPTTSRVGDDNWAAVAKYAEQEAQLARVEEDAMGAVKRARSEKSFHSLTDAAAMSNGSDMVNTSNTLLLWWLQSDTGIPVEPIVVTLLYYTYCFCVCELGRQFAMRCITKDHELQKILIEFFGCLLMSVQNET